MTTQYEINFLQGNTGPAIFSPSHIVKIVGAGGITVAGNQATQTLTINGTGSPSEVWTSISANTSLVSGDGYFCVGGGNLQLLLPPVSSVGDTIEIGLVGSSGFTVIQNASQFVKLGNLQTTAGVGGSMSSTNQGDFLRLICYTTNIAWLAVGSVGNLTIV
jgi:hypothetical protein